MTQEDKKLLFKDLSARLPYHVRVKVWLKDGTTEEGALDLEHNYADVLRDAFYYNKIVDIKPYLRPMSSMTLEEIEEFRHFKDYLRESECKIHIANYNQIQWLFKKHFDFLELIPKGLAIEVTKENNPYKIIN